MFAHVYRETALKYLHCRNCAARPCRDVNECWNSACFDMLWICCTTTVDNN